MICRLIASLAAALLALHAGLAHAQGALPAPVPDQSPAPASVSPFPQRGVAPLIGLSGPPLTSGWSEACVNDFKALREEAEKRASLIKAAADRKSSPDEACKLIVSFGQAEIKMIRYVETNAAKCGIPQQIADKLQSAHKGTDAIMQKVCSVAQKQQRLPEGPVEINDIGDPAIEDRPLFRISPPPR